MARYPVIGHTFSGTHIFIIYQDDSGVQYAQQLGEKEHICQTPGKPYLPVGTDWHDSGQWTCKTPNAERTERIAIHESGHAAIYIIEGITIEFISIEPIKGLGDGLCQCDWKLREIRQTAEPYSWAEKEAKTFLGGMAAEIRWLKDRDKLVAPIHALAWNDDHERFVKQVLLRSELGKLDPKREDERLKKVVLDTMHDPNVWDGVNRIAQRLLVRGAISGKTALALFNGIEPS